MEYRTIFHMIRKNGPNYRWYILAIACIAVAFISGAGRLCMPVLFKEISQKLNLDLVSIGTVWGMDPLAGIFIGLPAGLIADRFGVKRTLVLVCFAAAVFGMLRGLSINFITLAGSMFLYGIFSGTASNVVTKATALWFDEKRIALANALVNVMWSLGSITATMTSATVLSPALGGWREVLFFWAAPCFIAGLLWLFTGRDPAKGEIHKAANEQVPFKQAMLHVMGVKQVWIIGLVCLAHYGATMGCVGYMAIYLRNIGWSTTAADSAFTVLNGVGTLGIIPMVMLSDRLKSRKAILGLAIVTFTMMLALFPFVNAAGIWLLLIVVGFLRAGAPSMISVMIFETEGIGGTYGGTAIGLSSSVGMVGAFLAPPIGNAFARYSAGAPMLFWAVLSILAMAPLFFTKEKTRNILQAN
ncbi:MAG TPA: MFS transporter [Dehalococcoidales bacterium]|nr:MFS transporter [Dehalococcoidales bacterium]